MDLKVAPQELNIPSMLSRRRKAMKTIQNSKWTIGTYMARAERR
jgi:hypothetical protein